ncbi:MAG: transporter substrate-binding domain-containing protein [Rhodospirillaceae bacterium]|jgi:polar amino acid transport system substrate-binding protein|nr:transporter substrate-binding domain-containing protein [Rhodospirillales bacterium]MBT3907490.1 transporter substrate-binding domain-containing protein [Rhodospirillaceae bacterium]MBT4699743.1 transporter substrate-binding domain-containing protein [Rhodospirillaceae bacterium]MBT5035555.1 transporter substrate-binding domain-containing protein [Rhodospirillaceae bacterium]MBT6219090.1 transporter substrate-binding domain-containing protein [Rhodospirillaceae bacterium]
MRRFINVVVVTSGVFLLALTPLRAMTVEEAAKRLEAITWYSEEYPPYNFKANGQAEGMAVDILMAAFKKIGAKITPKDIKIVPWNRSYKYIQKKPGTALFSMTKTPERAKLMKFVGPAVPIHVAVIAPKTAKLKVNAVADLNNLVTGAVRYDLGDQMIRKLTTNDKAVVRKNSLKQLLYLLGAGRIDAVAYSVDVFNYTVKKSGGDPKDYESIHVLNTSHMGYAFHKSTDAAILAPLQKALDELRVTGVIDKIIFSYMKQPPLLKPMAETNGWSLK